MLKPGFNYLNPCTEDVLTVDMRIQSYLLGRQVIITKDNIQLNIEAAVYYRYINPIKVTYGIGMDRVHLAIREAGFDVVRQAFGEHAL
jgi:regulator of protease activity HflC (stomatin/prohibitin superfamily)